jgi:hypothetical protein
MSETSVEKDIFAVSSLVCINDGQVMQCDVYSFLERAGHEKLADGWVGIRCGV